MAKNEKAESFELPEKEEEVEQVDDFVPTFDDKIKAWLERVNLDDLTPRIYIYKKTATDRRTLCGRFEGTDIPDEHEIGLMYGSGTYNVIVVIPPSDKDKGQRTSFNFVVGQHYDQMRREQQFQGSSPFTGLRSLPQQTFQPANSSEMFKDALAFIAEIMSKINVQQTQQPALPDVSNLMLMQYKTMGELMKNNLLQTDQLLTDGLKKARSAMAGDEPEGDVEEKSLVERMLPEIIKLLPALLASPKTGPVINQALSSQQVQKAISNQAVMQYKKAMMIKKMKNDRLKALQEKKREQGKKKEEKKKDETETIV